MSRVSDVELTREQADRLYVAMLYAPLAERVSYALTMAAMWLDGRAHRTTRRWADHFTATGRLPAPWWRRR
jgi:hypothetical protein